MRRLLAALLVLTLVPAIAFARFEKLVKDVDALFERMSGYVVSVEDGMLYTDFGRDKGIFKGMIMKIYRENEPIIHPITKQVLGNKKIYVGDIKVSEVFDKYSTGIMVKEQRSVKAGDIITVNPPIPVQLETSNLPKRLDMLLKEELGTAENILMKDQARLKLNFIQQDDGGIKYSVVDQPTKTTIHSKFFSDKDLKGAFGASATKDIFRSDTLDVGYKSMSVGHAKGGKEIYIAAASSRVIDFYRFTGNKFIREGSVDDRFINIQHVELADLDKDGVEELFVTEIVKETFVRSSVYEFDGDKFKLVKKDLPYIIRSTYSGGIKKVLMQRITETGKYIGLVSELEYSNGEYVKGEPVSGTREASIYGFGYADLNGDGSREVLSIDSKNRLRVYNGGGLKYTSAEEFGQTPHYFTLEQEVKGSEIELDGTLGHGEDDPFVFEKLKKFIRGRLFVNSDNNVYVIKNSERFNMLEKTKIYGSSKFAVFSWDGRKLRSMWNSDLFHPVISDYYMYEEFGRTYLFLLRNFRDNILFGDKSEFIYIETR